MSAGSRSGVHCSRRKSRPRARGEAARGQCLAQPGHVFKEHVAAGEDARQRELDGFAHPDHHGGDALEDRRAQPRDLLNRQVVGSCSVGVARSGVAAGGPGSAIGGGSSFTGSPQAVWYEVGGRWRRRLDGGIVRGRTVRSRPRRRGSAGTSAATADGRSGRARHRRCGRSAARPRCRSAGSFRSSWCCASRCRASCRTRKTALWLTRP